MNKHLKHNKALKIYLIHMKHPFSPDFPCFSQYCIIYKKWENNIIIITEANSTFLLDLKYGRVDHACGVMTLESGEDVIVVAGGRWIDTVNATVEMIKLAKGQDLNTTEVESICCKGLFKFNHRWFFFATTVIHYN